MAFNVIICHFVCVYYPQMYFVGRGGALSCFADTPLSALANGNIAVVFFFALTGFLVGRSVFLKNTDANTIGIKSLNRYLKFLPVVFLATLFTFLTMKTGLQYHLLITNENVNIEFLSGYCNFNATLGNLISNIFYEPFLRGSAYIGPFWTIKYEFWGYIVVLITAVSFKDSKWRRFSYLIVAGIIGDAIDSYYTAFIMGLLVSDLLFNNTPTVCNKYYQKILTNKIFILICFFVSTYFACCPLYEGYPLYAFWFKLPFVNHVLLRSFGMALFIWVAANSKLIQKILSCRSLVFLGEMSFETYALHWPLMLTCEAWLFNIFEKRYNYNAAALLAFAITVVVIYFASFLFSLIVKRINAVISDLQKKVLAETQKQV